MQTLGGRCRWIPGLRGGEAAARAAAKRAAINSIPQGSGADVAKRGLLALCAAIDGEGLGADVFPVLQIHDELLLEVREGCVEKVRSPPSVG